MARNDVPEFTEDYSGEEGDEYVLQWMLPGEVWHRKGKPAILARDGETYSESYLDHGVHHRKNAPAVLEMDHRTGDIRMFWYTDGEKHRENGPAVVYLDGKTGAARCEWWVHGEFVRAEGSLPPEMYNKNWHLTRVAEQAQFGG
jgi:hypothetical protein